ncbi:MAG: FAD-binding protein [Acidimicrobiales bacterium]
MSEQNWAGNYTYRAADWRRPTSVDELQAAVGAADRIGVIGSRHSFNGLGDADTVIDLTALPHMDAPCRGIRRVAVAAHMTYAEVAAWPAWSALANLASLPHISVAGAVATGTHGSGSRTATFPRRCAAYALVRADGALVGVAADDLAKRGRHGSARRGRRASRWRRTGL